MIERMARAIDPEPWDQSVIEDAYYPAARRRLQERRHNAGEAAKRVLTAMREPTPGMHDAAQRAVSYNMTRADFTKAFQALIDHILTEREG